MSEDHESGTAQAASTGAGELEQLKAENERLRAALEESSVDEEAVHAAKVAKRRRMSSIGLAVVLALLLPPAVATVWVRNRLLDTETYVQTVAPLAEDPAIQGAVAERITIEVGEALDLKSVAEDLLPEEAAPLAGVIASGAENLIGDLANRAVESDQFTEIWEAANREAHERLVPLLTGGEGEVLEFSDGKVVVPIDDLVDTVLGGIEDATGLDVASIVPDDAISGEFVLYESQDLADLQDAVAVFDTLSWLIVLAVVLLLAGTIFIAVDRRLGVRRAGIALAVSMLLTLAVFALARQAYLDALEGVVLSIDAAAAAFDILTNFLRQSLRVGLALGVVLLVGAWLVGPSRAAVRVRSWGQALIGAVDQRTGERDLGPVPRWVKQYETPLTWTVVALGAVVLVAWSNPSGLNVLVIAAVVAALVGLVRLVAGIARPDALAGAAAPTGGAAEGADAAAGTGGADGGASAGDGAGGAAAPGVPAAAVATGSSTGGTATADLEDHGVEDG